MLSWVRVFKKKDEKALFETGQLKSVMTELSVNEKMADICKVTK